MERLTGVVRAYDWGRLDALAELLGYEPPGHPEAEYWLGAHPTAPSALGEDRRPLDAVIGGDPAALLGPMVAERFGEFPFLLKILAAERPLSVQAHPSPHQAEAGFAREEAVGPARDAFERNYRDANHKPELICAVTTFEAKCGFGELPATRRLLDRFGPVLADIAARLDGPGEAAGRRDVVSHLLHLPPAEAARLADATVDKAAELLAEMPADGTRPFGPELEWTVRIGRTFPGDIGVVVALLLNHVVLEPGQALFLPAGNLHAYLHGVGVEVMANSDNVLRAGLTSKHIDVDELLAVVDWAAAPIPVQRPGSAVHTYEVPVPEFALTRLDAGAGTIDGTLCSPVGPEVVLVVGGAVTLVTDGCRLDLDRGQAAFVAASDGPYRIVDRAPGRTLAWRATVGAVC